MKAQPTTTKKKRKSYNNQIPHLNFTINNTMQEKYIQAYSSKPNTTMDIFQAA